MEILRGPVELIAGLVGGCILGLVSGYLPQKDDAQWKLSTLVGLGGFSAVIGSIQFSVPGAGPLIAIASAFIANLIWTKRGMILPGKNPVAVTFTKIWTVVQPILFGLIGAEIDLTTIKASQFLQNVVILFSGLTLRLLSCLVCLLGIGLNWKEILLVNLAWLPKATVQAALSPLPLDHLRGQPDSPDLPLAKLVLTTAVLAIIVTAPLGAVSISLSGPLLLNKQPSKE